MKGAQNVEVKAKLSPVVPCFASRVNILLLHFCDKEDVIRKEFGSKGGGGENSELCFLRVGAVKFIEVRPQFSDEGSWFTLHGSASARVA